MGDGGHRKYRVPRLPNLPQLEEFLANMPRTESERQIQSSGNESCAGVERAKHNQGAFARGWEDTKSCFHEPLFWFAEVASGALAVWYLESELMAIAGASLLLFSILFARTVTAPLRQRNEARHEIAALLERSAPTVAIRFDSSCIKEKHGTRSVGVRIKNRSDSQSVHNVVLYMEGFLRRNKSGNYADISNELTFFSNNCRISEPVSIGPGFERFVYIAQEKYDHPADKPVYFHGSGSDKFQPGEYEVHLVVTGLDVPPERMILLISKPTIEGGDLTAEVKL